MLVCLYCNNDFLLYIVVVLLLLWINDTLYVGVI